MKAAALSALLVSLAHGQPCSASELTTPETQRAGAPSAGGAPASQTAAGAHERQAEALVLDLKRIVAAETSLGWVVDEHEIDDIYPTVMRSVCRTLPEARLVALRKLEEERRRLGDPKALYLAAGRELTGEAEQALSAERQLQGLRRALAGAARDCPFWMEPSPEFGGLQTDRNRFTLNLESGGVAILRETASNWTIGAGGFARVLGAYGFAGEMTLLAGPELGGAALLAVGSEATGLVVHYFPAVPVILRLRDVAWHYDIEAAPVALWQAEDVALSFGTRLATTVGVSALYTTGFIPWAGVSLAYEYYWASGSRPDAHFARFGFRAGISWDP